MTEAAPSSNFIITGTGNAVGAHYLNFLASGSATSSLANVYGDQAASTPTTHAILTQASGGGGNYVMWAVLEGAYALKLTFNSGTSSWSSQTLYALDSPAAVTPGGSASVKTLSLALTQTHTFSVTLTVGTLCSSASVSGATYVIQKTSATTGSITAAGFAPFDYSDHDVIAPLTTNYVSAYDSGTSTFTVKVKGFLVGSGGNAPNLRVQFIYNDGTDDYFCMVMVQAGASYLFSSDPPECYTLVTGGSCSSSSSTVNCASADIATENDYTFTIGTETASC